MQGAQSLSRFRGVGRYSLSLALAMARRAGEHEIWLALNDAFPESILNIRHAFNGLIPEERIRIFRIPAPVAEIELSNAWRARAAEKIREYFLEQVNPDVIHVSSLFEGYTDDAVTSIGRFTAGRCTAVTLYDLIPLLNQRDYLTNNTQRDYYLRKVKSLKNASLLLAISETSRREAIDALQIHEHQVSNISAAVDEKFRPLAMTSERTHQVLCKYGIARKIVMYAPGGFDSRKNFEGLIDAYSMLSPALRANHQLVIAGNIEASKHIYMQSLSRHAGLAKDELVITGYIPDEELVEFYNLATLFVCPSTHEGFGLPALEAMACGVPTIGSNTTSLPEVIGFADALFDPLSPQSISKKMAQALCDISFSNKLSTHGLRQALNFTWDDCAKRTFNAFEALIQASRTVLPASEILHAIPELLLSISENTIADKPSDSDLVRVADCVAFNTGYSAPRQLLLDVSVIVHGDAKSGIQRVVRSLLRELIGNPPQNTEVRAIYFDGTHYVYANAFISTFFGMLPQSAPDDVVDFCQGDIYLALDLNAHLTAKINDIHFRLQCRGIKLYFIIYDILLVQHPEWWPTGASVIFEEWLRSISTTATGLFCISEAVAREVRDWLSQNPPQRPTCPTICSFSLGADVISSFPSKGLPDDVNAKLSAFSAIPSFLMVGTIEPRKGHAQTLSAFEMLWTQGINVNLVIVGKHGWLVDKLVGKIKRHPELNRRLFWLEGISDEYLEKVYAVCSCLLSSSFDEGFGLPLIEAAQYKKPIIARDIPVFREVAGEHAFYFNGLLPENLAGAITAWLVLYSTKMNPKSEGMRCSTWQESAQQLKELLGLSRGQNR